MANELQQLAEWTFLMETKPPKGIQDILVDGEDVVCCFKTVRDVAIFTNKRLIVRDTQGMTGIKKETYSLPYKSINMYTTENAGIADTKILSLTSMQAMTAKEAEENSYISIMRNNLETLKQALN